MKKEYKVDLENGDTLCSRLSKKLVGKIPSKPSGEWCECKQRISDFYINGQRFCNDCKKPINLSPTKGLPEKIEPLEIGYSSTNDIVEIDEKNFNYLLDKIDELREVVNYLGEKDNE